MLPSKNFSPSIVQPALPCRFNGLLLALLGTSAKKNYEALYFFAEIDPVTWAEVNFPFKDTPTDRFGIPPVPCGNLI